MNFQFNIFWGRIGRGSHTEYGIFRFTYANKDVISINPAAPVPAIKHRQGMFYSRLSVLLDSNMCVKIHIISIASLTYRNCGIITRYYELPV